MPDTELDRWIMEGRRTCSECGYISYDEAGSEQRLREIGPWICSRCSTKMRREILEEVDRVEPRRKLHVVLLPDCMKK